MQGYHNMPQKTAETLHNGWLYTGDIGRIDENGYLFLLDRVNDMIITGGMNVYSAEVESAVQTVTGVEHVAVVGVPDDDWGERVVAFVVPAKDGTRCRGHPRDVPRTSRSLQVPQGNPVRQRIACHRVRQGRQEVAAPPSGRRYRLITDRLHGASAKHPDTHGRSNAVRPRRGRQPRNDGCSVATAAR